MALVPFPGPQGTAVSLPPEDDDEASGARMSFLDHLDELRRRIVNSCIAIAIGIAATFYWIDKIFNFILAPTRAALPPGVKLIYTQPGEAFSLYITIALIAGAVVASPFIMLQVCSSSHRGSIRTRNGWRFPSYCSPRSVSWPARRSITTSRS